MARLHTRRYFRSFYKNIYLFWTSLILFFGDLSSCIQNDNDDNDNDDDDGNDDSDDNGDNNGDDDNDDDNDDCFSGSNHK